MQRPVTRNLITTSGDDPLYSIRRAAKWTMLGSDKLPSIAAVIADVKLVIGRGCWIANGLLSAIVL
jgi:hypothetical protein